MMHRSLHIILLTLLGVLSVHTQNVYFGDLHVHSTFSFDGKKGTPVEVFRYAKDSTRLDFIALTDHDTASSLRQWDSSRYLAEMHHVPGSFVTLFGYEYTHREGHRIVLYPDSSHPIRYAAKVAIEDIYDSIRQAGGLTVIAHPNYSPYASHIDWGGRSQGDLIEMIGVNGYRFEYLNNPVPPPVPFIGSAVQDWLKARKMMGFIGSSDDHEGRPARFSLTGVWANALTRGEIFESLRKRRTFATNGVRMKGRIMTQSHMMGDTVYLPERSEIRINYEIEGTAELQNFSVIRNGTVIKTIDVKGTKTSGSFTDKDTSRYSYYYLRVPQTGGGMLWTTPLYVFRSLVVNSQGRLTPAIKYGRVSVMVYPNPFNGTTVATIDMPYKDEAQISLYNLLGQKVFSSVLGPLPQGQSDAPIDLADTQSGVYILKVQTSRSSAVTKLIHTK